MRVWTDACQKISFLYLWFNSWLYKYVRNNVNNLSKLLTGFCTNKLQIWQQATMNGPHRHALFYTLMQYCCKLNATNILQWVHSCGLGVYGQSMESWVRYIFGGMIIPNEPTQILVTFRLTIMLSSILWWITLSRTPCEFLCVIQVIGCQSSCHFTLTDENWNAENEGLIKHSNVARMMTRRQHLPALRSAFVWVCLKSTSQLEQDSRFPVSMPTARAVHVGACSVWLPSL